MKNKMLCTLIRSNRSLMIRLILIGLSFAMLAPQIAEAAAITITNKFDTTFLFETDVTGSVSHFPPFFQIHNLVDIPGTPWVSSSRIVELAGLTADTVRVTWTIQHILGPDPQDVNPNPNEPVTLNLSFTAVVPGPFIALGPLGTPGVRFVVDHPLTIGGPHFNVFDLDIFGNVAAGLLGRLDITSYTIRYTGRHCPDVTVPAGTCIVDGGGGGGGGGLAEVPEPATLILLGSGLAGVGLVRWRRNRRG